MPMQLYKPGVCLSGIGKGNSRGAHDMSTGILWLGKVQGGPNHPSVHLHPEHTQNCAMDTPGHTFQKSWLAWELDRLCHKSIIPAYWPAIAAPSPCKTLTEIVEAKSLVLSPAAWPRSIPSTCRGPDQGPASLQSCRAHRALRTFNDEGSHTKSRNEQTPSLHAQS